MGHVYDEFERTLEAWRVRYAGQPRREILRLCLIALEREELVTIAYRESLILQRLAAMPIPQDVRTLIHHALVWAWKDEEMHAIYIRGAIFRLGSTQLRLRAYARQIAGAIGGWSTSVRQHVRWSEAPVSRAASTVITWLGSLLGQVPKDVRQHLRYGSFRDFCRFNVDAEKTAWMCWGRLAELASKHHELPPALVEEFRRVQRDELAHTRIFEIFAAALDDQDRLAPGVNAELLEQRIREVGEFFLPRARRCGARNTHPLGSGGRVHVALGTSPSEKLPVFRQLLLDSDLAGLIRERARQLQRPLADLRIAVKATFMMGYDRKDLSIVTDPVLISELARYLRSLGCADVAVVEGRNIYDKFYRNRTVSDVARYFGIGSPDFRVVDASDEQVPHAYFRGMAQHTIAETWKKADLRISFAKMRSHPIELAYLTVGNMEWLGARCDEFVFAERQAERETAIMMLLDEFPPQFAIVDAYDLAADGLVGVMGCPRPKSPKRLYAGRDALAVDAVAARHMGLNDLRESSILRAACHWFGVTGGRMDARSDWHIEVVGADRPLTEWRGPYHNELSTMMSILAFPVYVVGSGRGALFVPEMDPHAFPLAAPESTLLHLARRSVRGLLGLHHPN
jgi:uncharacterized protein (DUF362 family)